MAQLKKFKDYLHQKPLNKKNNSVHNNMFEALATKNQKQSTQIDFYETFLKIVRNMDWDEAYRLATHNPQVLFNTRVFFKGDITSYITPSPFGHQTSFEDRIESMSWASYFVLMEQPKLFDLFTQKRLPKKLTANENNNPDYATDYSFSLLSAILLKDDLATLKKMEAQLCETVSLKTVCSTIKSIQETLYDKDENKKTIDLKMPKIVEYIAQRSDLQNCPPILLEVAVKGQQHSLASKIIKENKKMAVDYILMECHQENITAKNIENIMNVVAEYTKIYGEAPKKNNQPLLVFTMHNTDIFQKLAQYEEPIEQLKDYLKNHSLIAEFAWKGPVLQVLHNIGYPIHKITDKGNIVWQVIDNSQDLFNDKNAKAKELQDSTEFFQFFIKNPEYLHLFTEKIKGKTAIDLLSKSKNLIIKQSSLKLEKLLLKNTLNFQQKTHLNPILNPKPRLL